MRRTAADINQFPLQKLPMSKKTEQWGQDCVNYVINASDLVNSADLPDAEEMQSNYDLYNSIYDESELKHVTNPFNQKDGFPAKAQMVNKIRSLVDLLVGEETKRPYNFSICRTSYIASGQKQEEAKALLMDYVMAYSMSQLGPEEQQRFQEAIESGEVMPPEQIQRYLTKDYKDIMEITAYYSLKYLTQKLNVTHEFVKGFYDALIAAMEVYYVGVRNGDPFMMRINPKDFVYDAAEGVEFIHDASWCCYRMRKSAQQIWDDYHDKLDEKDLDDLIELMQGKPGSNHWGPDKGKLDDFNPIKTKIFTKLPNGNPYVDLNNIIVYHSCWRSYKKIGFVTMEDPETGMIEEFQVDETYKVTGFEISVEWKWIIEVWEGYRAGDELYWGIQPVEHQYIDETLNSQKLPYTGAVYSNTNSDPKSFVSILKPLQYQLISYWYRLELLLAKDKGRIINMDITQIPTSMGIDPARWMHYLAAMGINFINPYEEGWDIPGREGGKPAPFNQISSQDLGVGNQIGEYIKIIEKIEQMMNEISGITPERQGAVTASQLVGNVERSVLQSNNITEPQFWKHNQVKRHVLTMMLDTAKAVWPKYGKSHLDFVLDDGTRAFLEIAEDFPYETFDIFVTDSTKEVQTIETLKQLIQPAMQNGASLADVTEILTTDNVSMIKQKLEEIENTRLEREQAQIEQEQQMQMELAQLEQEQNEQKLLLEQAKLDLEKYKIDVDAETRIVVAEINAYRGKAELDQDNSGIPDPIEIADQAIARQKMSADIASRNLDLALKQREQESKRKLDEKKVEAQKKSDELKATIEKKKLALEEKKMRSQEKIQKQKDKAAMDREKLKARTALKNKVVGEK